MEKLVKTIVPSFPGDRKVSPTPDQGKFFRIDYNARTLFVPQEKALRANFQLIDKFTDAIQAFAVADLTVHTDWSKVTFVEDHGDEMEALGLIDQMIVYITEKYVRTGEPLYASSDIETRHVHMLDNDVLAVGFCLKPMEAFIITCFTPKVREALNSLYGLPQKMVRWIWHNGKFDSKYLLTLIGVEARVDEDTELLHFTRVNERRGTHRLKELGPLLCQSPQWDDELQAYKKQICSQMRIRLDDFTYDMFPREILLPYLAYDVAVTVHLYWKLLEIAREGSEFIYRKLIQASKAYRDVEARGVVLDMHYLEGLEYSLDKEIAEAHKELEKAANAVWDCREYQRDSGAKSCPKFFNMKSPAQLKWLLEKVTGQSVASTNKEVLNELFEDVGDDYPVINAIRNLRKLDKYMDTYVQGLRNLVAHDGRIHCSYNLHGTETGRLSASDPNMQNIPRDAKIKNLFVAAPGFKLLQLDYSQAELRVLAYLSQDPFLMSVYNNGQDLHDQVALSLFGEGFTKEDRVKAKAVNFGIVYGLGPGRLSKTQKISFQEAKTIIEGWLNNASGAKEWIQRHRNMVYEGELPTTPFGRLRHFVVTYEALNHIQNEYVNFPVQSLASDFTLFSVIEISDWIEQEGLQEYVHVIINVHDSIILEVKDDPQLIARVAKQGAKIMREVPSKYLSDMNVPFKADVEVGYSWGNLEKWHED